MNGYHVYPRQWFSFAFENPDVVSGNHGIVYLWAVELNNRLGWVKKFGIPSEMAMSAAGIKSYKTYSKIFEDLVRWGFFEVHQRSSNQYTADIIALVNFTEAHTEASAEANTKALTNAILSQQPEQCHGSVGIIIPKDLNTDIPINLETDDADRVVDQVISEPVVEEKKETPSKVPRKVSPPGFEFGLDMPFETAEFAEAWGDWAKFRMEIRHKLTASQAKAQLEKLSRQPSESIAIAVIRQSIENGWQGLFDLKAQRPQFGQPPPLLEKGKIQQGIENTYEAAQRIRERRLQQQQ